MSLVKGLKDRGHEVVVITEKPNHPEGVIWDEYKKGVFVSREYERVPVVYTWVFARPNKGFVNRVLFYASFMVLAIFGAIRLRGSFDVVIASSPPLLVGMSGWMVAKIKRARFVFDVRDIWPSVAIAMGELNNVPAVRLAEALERFIYRNADGIVAVTDSFCSHIAATSDTKVPMVRVMNGTMPRNFQKDDERADVRERIGACRRFVVTYAGNLGLAQGLSHVLDAADRVRDVPEVVFHFRGSGPVKDELQREAERRMLPNVKFFERTSLDEAASHMVASDALLVPLANHEIYQKFIPSKLFDCMASARPVLLSVDGESRAILEDASAGIYYPSEDGAALAESIRWLISHPEEAKQFGLNGRVYASKHCTRDAQGKKLAEFLEEIVVSTDHPKDISTSHDQYVLHDPKTWIPDTQSSPSEPR